jgi:hypothetical protein
MGHWYPWATREYILKKMSYQQLILYYSMIPESGRLVMKEIDDRPDLKGINKLKLGNIKRIRRK